MTLYTQLFVKMSIPSVSVAIVCCNTVHHEPSSLELNILRISAFPDFKIGNVSFLEMSIFFVVIQKLTSCGRDNVAGDCRVVTTRLSDCIYRFSKVDGGERDDVNRFTVADI